MAPTSSRHAWILAAALSVLLFSAGAYFHFGHRRHTVGISTPEGVPYPVSPQQVEQTHDLLDELPGDAPAIAYIDVQSLRKLPGSPLTALLGLTQDDSQRDREYERFVRETGFDYARDISRVAIAFWPGQLLASQSDPAGSGRAGNRVLAIAEGRFDQKRIEAYAIKRRAVKTTRDRSIYEVPGAPPITFEFLSATRIAITSGLKSNSLLTGRPAIAWNPDLRQRIDRVAGPPIFGVATTDKLPATFYAIFKGSPEIGRLARSVVGLTVAAQPQGQTLKLDFEAEATSPKNALEIKSLLDISRMGASVVLSNPGKSAQFTPEQAAFLDSVIRHSQISRRDRWVRITLDLTPEMLGSVNSQPSGERPAHSKSQNN